MSSLFDLSGRTALITGGSSGIGRAVAEAFAAHGARVITCARTPDPAVPGEHLVADLSTNAGTQQLAADVAAIAPELHVLVNNAGTTMQAPIEAVPVEDWDAVIQLNLTSLHYLTAACLPLLRAGASAEDPSRIINIGSVDGHKASMLESYAYSASKAAVQQLTRHYARRLASEHILVNAISPGMFPSRLSQFISDNPALLKAAESVVPLRRMGRPEEIGGSAVYLASRAGGYTTGEVLVVDGGITGAT